jgi:hypothetical protein
MPVTTHTHFELSIDFVQCFGANALTSRLCEPVNPESCRIMKQEVKPCCIPAAFLYFRQQINLKMRW